MGHRCKVGAAWWNPVRVRTCADTSGQRQSQYSQSNFFPHDPPPLLDAPERHFLGRTGWHDHKTNSPPPTASPSRPDFRDIYDNTFSTHPQWEKSKKRANRPLPWFVVQGSGLRVHGSAGYRAYDSGFRVVRGGSGWFRVHRSWFRGQGSGFSSWVRVRSKKPGNSKCSTLNPEICGATARGGTGRDIPRWHRDQTLDTRSTCYFTRVHSRRQRQTAPTSSGPGQ